MAPGEILAVSKRFIQRTVDLAPRLIIGTGGWASRVLPEQRIQWHRRRLGAAAAKLEKRFGHVSTSLEALAAQSAEMLESSRRLFKFSLGQDGGESVFQTAVAMMERPLTFNDECLQITKKVDQNLAAVAARIERLHRFKSALDGSIAPLAILQTMFRIESAARPPQILALFTSLSEEIENLLSQMSTMVVREFQAIESTAVSVHDVSTRLGEIHVRQVNARRRRQEIDASLKVLAAQLEKGKLRDVRMIGATERVAARVAGMVGAIQYQDILNQRLQHVIVGLAGIAESVRRSGSRAGLDILRFLRDACSVESAQLEDVECVLGGAFESLRESLHGLAGEMGELDSQCIHLHGVESPTAAVDGVIQVLLDTIQENLDLIDTTSAQTSEICTILEPIGGLLGNLTGSILELSAKIRLIALNAQIQAVQAGAGTGLEVLASRTRSIAEEIANIVTEIAEELAALKEGLTDGLRDIEYTRAKSLEFLRFLRVDGREQETGLHTFRDKMLAELRRVADLITGVQGESSRLAESLDMGSSVLEVVICAREELQDFSSRLSFKLGRGNRSAALEKHARSYTAASQRSAHARALNDEAGPVLSLPAPALVEGTVELF
jgi:methyl-accepting chemotaxis protein